MNKAIKVTQSITHEVLLPQEESKKHNIYENQKKQKKKHQFIQDGRTLS